MNPLRWITPPHTSSRAGVLLFTVSFAFLHMAGCSAGAVSAPDTPPTPPNSDDGEESERKYLEETVPSSHQEPKAPSAPLPPPDRKVVYTSAGFAWEVGATEQPSGADFCRIASPLTLHEVYGSLLPGDPCVAWASLLTEDKERLFALLLHPEPSVQRAAIDALVSQVTPNDARVVHGLMTHPRTDVQALGLELAGRAQLNMFLPEISFACHRNPSGPLREACSRAVASLNSLGGHALRAQFPLESQTGSPDLEVLPLRVQLPAPFDCPPDSRLVPEPHGRPLTSFLVPVFEAGRKGESFSTGDLPGLLKFALQSGKNLRMGQVQTELRRLKALEMLLDTPGGLGHPCDRKLVNAIRDALSRLREPAEPPASPSEPASPPLNSPRR